MIGRSLIVFPAAGFLTVGVLVMMNNACERSHHHSWCASESSIPFYAKNGR